MEIVGSPVKIRTFSLTPNFARYSGERSSTRKLLRTLTAKSFADLRVKVNPKILSGSTNPLAIK